MRQDDLQRTPFQPYMFTGRAVLTTGSHRSVTLCRGEARQSLYFSIDYPLGAVAESVGREVDSCKPSSVLA